MSFSKTSIHTFHVKMGVQNIERQLLLNNVLYNGTYTFATVYYGVIWPKQHIFNPDCNPKFKLFPFQIIYFLSLIVAKNALEMH